jgi:hypothetical protein
MNTAPAAANPDVSPNDGPLGRSLAAPGKDMTKSNAVK